MERMKLAWKRYKRWRTWVASRPKRQDVVRMHEQVAEHLAHAGRARPRPE